VATERITAHLPEGFDAARHMVALGRKIAETYGEGWVVDSIDPAQRIAYATRQSATIEVSAPADTADVIEVRLPRGTKPSDGDRVAARLEDQHPGYCLVDFDPYLGKAVLHRLSEPEQRCRGAVAVALGVKPWDVRVTALPDGGFDLVLPPSYTPSKHDKKLDEVATVVVGKPGWYVDADPAALSASIIPSEPPTFPAVVPYPLDRMAKMSPDKAPVGVALPAPGSDRGPVVAIDWRASSWALLAGQPGSGKTVATSAIIAGALASGSELAVVDDTNKAVDYLWCKPFVRRGGWGCGSLAEAVTTLGLVYDEGRRRARVLAEAGVVGWHELPPGKAFPPLLVVVDEVTALLTPRRVPSGIPKDHPMRIEALEENLLHASIDRYLQKIIAELRFVRVRALIASQVVNDRTGVGPSLKAKIGHHVLCGANPSKTARSQALADESSVPTVPDNVRSDPGASVGVGVAELEGAAPCVLKTLYATTDQYRAALERLGAPRTDRPAPTAGEIADYAPALDDGDNSPGDGSGAAPVPGRQVSPEVADADDDWDVDPGTGERLTGYERANMARHVATERAKRDETR
jgi:hypothetical protein